MDGAKEYRTGDNMRLQIQTDSQALVALGAVDTALYAVGGKSHRPLDMSKVCQALPISSEPKLWGLVLQSLGPHRPHRSPLAASSLVLGLWFPTAHPSSLFEPCPKTHSGMADADPWPLVSLSISCLILPGL